tara:strand:- start:1685 stop:2011 length:327 start_codon:yes stop_codon:yes gene_type:complete
MKEPENPTEEEVVIIIKKTDRDNVVDILNNHRIKFHQAGYPGGSYKLTESYQSKMNKKKGKHQIQKEHNSMLKYIAQLGCKDIGEAIVLKGGGAAFRRSFKSEYVEKK